jgi:polysaccharide export outer membrane protein
MRILDAAVIVLLANGVVAGASDASQAAGPATVAPSSYVLGPNDQVMVEVVELPEFSSKSYHIDSDGTVSLPLLGRIQAAGLTLKAFEASLNERLRTQVRNPHLITGVIETRSQPVSVMGAVNSPGTQQLQGVKTLFDVIAGAGGLKPEAGESIKIMRHREYGELNLANAVKDPATGSSTAEVNTRDVVDLRDPKANIIVQPLDEISVPRAQVLYVVGNVKKAGGFTMSQKRSVSALEALSLAEGLAPNAAPQNAHILRVAAGNAERERIPINLKNVLSGKAHDMQLLPDDILYIPDNSARRLAGRVAETALATASGLVIWRGF